MRPKKINKADGAFTPSGSAKINSSQCSQWLVNQTLVWMTQPSGTFVSKGCGAAYVVKANKWITALVADVWFQCKTKIRKLNPFTTSGICLRSVITAPLLCQHSHYHRELWELIHQWPMSIWCFSARTSSCVSFTTALLPGIQFSSVKAVFLPVHCLFLQKKNNAVLKFFQGPKEEKEKMLQLYDANCPHSRTLKRIITIKARTVGIVDVRNLDIIKNGSQNR